MSYTEIGLLCMIVIMFVLTIKWYFIAVDANIIIRRAKNKYYWNKGMHDTTVAGYKHAHNSILRDLSNRDKLIKELRAELKLHNGETK